MLRGQALLDYGTLVGEHGRRVRRRWILVADTIMLSESVARMRTIPVSQSAIAGVLVPAVLPLIALAAIRIPVKDIVLKIVQTLL